MNINCVVTLILKTNAFSASLPLQCYPSHITSCSNYYFFPFGLCDFWRVIFHNLICLWIPTSAACSIHTQRKSFVICFDLTDTG